MRELRVQPVAKQGCYTSVADALRDATSTSVVVLSPGTYRESSLSLDRPGIKMISEGDGIPVIHATSEGVCVSASATVTGIHFTSEDPEVPAVVITGGSPVFSKCLFQSMLVDVDGTPSIQTSTFMGSETSALTISGSAAGEYKNNIFKMSRIYGMLIDCSGSPFIHSNQFSNTGFGAICICGPKSTPVLKMNNVQDVGNLSSSKGGSLPDLTPAASDRAAITVANGAAPVIEHNTIFAGDGDGISIFGKGWQPVRIAEGSDVSKRANKATNRADSGVVNLVRNTIRDNKGYAIKAQNTGVRIVTDSNIVQDNHLGISVEGGAALNMKNDTLENIPGVGISCSGQQSAITLASVSVSQCKGGLIISGQASGKAASCTLEKNEYGCRVSARGFLQMEQCVISKNDIGLNVEEFGVCAATSTTMEANSAGVLGRANGCPFVSKCTFRRNQVGVHVTTGSTGKVSECTLVESTSSQILCEDRALTIFLDNDVRDADVPGVHVRKNGLGQFVSNQFRNHRAATVKVELNADPVFEDNILDGGSAEGFLIDRSGVGTYLRNTVRNFKSAPGVVIRRGAEPVFRGNTIEKNSPAGVELQQGARGIVEKNTISGNAKMAVSVTGSNNALATVAKNKLENSPVGILACDCARSLLISNTISGCEIGAAALTRSEISLVSNDIRDNNIGVLVSDQGTRGNFSCNTIAKNTDAGAVVRSNCAPIFSNNRFLGHFEESPPHAVKPSAVKPTGESKQMAFSPALFLCESAAAKFCGDTFMYNGLAVFSNRTSSEFLDCLFAENRCGFLSTNAADETLFYTKNASEHSQYVNSLPSESSVLAPPSEVELGPPVSLLSCHFLENGIGVSIKSGGSAQVEGCVLARQTFAGAVVAGQCSLKLSASVFVENGKYSLLARGAPQSDKDGTQVTGCLFTGDEAPVVLTKSHAAMKVSSSVFVRCAVEVSDFASPLLIGNAHTGSTGAFAASLNCTENQSVEYVAEGESRSRQSVMGQRAVDHNRMTVSVWSFPLSHCLRFIANAAGEVKDSVISFGDEGIVLEKCTTNVTDSAIHRCKTSGVTVGPGYRGAIDGAASFQNYGCGLRVTGKMMSPAVVRRASIFGNAVVDLKRDSDGQDLALPDTSEDAPFTGIERDTKAKSETHPAPKYTCPPSDGPGLGVVVEASGCAVIEDCQLFANGLANVIVHSKILSVLTRCTLYSSDGYGAVLRPGANCEFHSSFFVSNALSGLLCESASHPRLSDCTVTENALGILCCGDKSSIHKCNISSNRIAGVRFSDGTHARVADCEVSANGCGLECRAPITTQPYISNCDIYENLYCGVVCTGNSKASLTENLIRNHADVAGVMVRCSSICTIEKCHLINNKSGIVCRLHGNLQASWSLLSKNDIAVVVEFSGTGAVHRCAFKNSTSNSILCRTGGDAAFEENLFSNEQPVVVTMEGQPKFTANTFEAPKGSAFLIQRGGNPVIKCCRFGNLDAHRSAEEKKKAAAQELSPDDMIRSSSMHVRRKTVLLRPPDDELEERRRASVQELKAEREYEGVDESLLMTKAAQIVESQITSALNCVPIRVELGGLGSIEECVFIGNNPCSIIVDGTTTEPTISNNIFVDHTNVAVIVSNDGTPRFGQNLFLRNKLAVQVSTASCKVSRGIFIDNNTGVESGTNCGGLVTQCVFLNQDLAVNCLGGTVVSVQDSMFVGNTTCCYFDEGSSARFVRNTCFDSSKSAVTSQSDSAVQVVESTKIFGGACGIVVATNGMLKLKDVDVVGCVGAGIAFHTESGNTTREAAQGSLLSSRVCGCGIGVSMHGFNVSPTVQDVVSEHCKVGIECRSGANPTVQTSKLRYNNVGLFVHTGGLGVLKRLEVMANTVGIILRSGENDLPSVTHSNILDSQQHGIELDGDAEGEVKDSWVFDNTGTGIRCLARAATEVDYVVVSQNTSQAKGDRCVTYESPQHKVKIGENVSIKYDHSPPYNQLNSRLRAEAHETDKAEYAAELEALRSLQGEEKTKILRSASELLGVFGLTMDTLKTFAKSTKANGILDAPMKDREEGQQSLGTVGVDSIDILRSDGGLQPSRVTSDVDEEEADSFEKSTASRSGQGKKTRKKRKSLVPKVAGRALPTMVSVKRKVRAKKRSQAQTKESLKTRLSVLSGIDGVVGDEQPFGAAPQPDPFLGTVTVASPGLSISRKDSGDLLEATTQQLFFLPRLPDAALTSTSKPYPRKRVPIPKTDDTVPLLPPIPPQNLAKACLLNPQHGKFGYSTDLHALVGELSRMHSPMFADQVLQAFHFTDRRHRESLCAPDVARFVEHLCSLYRYHPGRKEAARRASLHQQRSRRSTDFSSSSMAFAIPEGETKPHQSVVILPDEDALDGGMNTNKARKSIAMAVSPFMPVPAFASEFARNSFLELFSKDPDSNEITISEFTSLLLYKVSVMFPVFETHFTWMPTIDDDSRECE